MATKLKDKLKKATQSATRAANEAARKTAQKTGVKEKQNNSTPVRNVQSKTKAKVDKAKAAAKEQNRTPKNKGTSKPVKRVQQIAEQSKAGQQAKKKEEPAKTLMNAYNRQSDIQGRQETTARNFAKKKGTTVLPSDMPFVRNAFDPNAHKNDKDFQKLKAQYDVSAKLEGKNPDKLTLDEYHKAYTMEPQDLLNSDSKTHANFARNANHLPSKKKTDKELVQDATKKLKQATHKKGAKQQKTSIYDQSLGKQWENEIKLNKQSWDAADALYKAALRRGDEKAAEKYAKQRDEAHEQAEAWRRIKGGFSGGASGDEYIRPKLDTKDKNLLNKEGEKRLAAAKLGYENAKTDAEKAMYAAMGQSIRNNPKYNLKKGREQRGETYDPGAYREFDANGRMRYAGTKEERKKEQEQTLAIPKTIAYTTAGAFASIPGTTARAIREDAYNNQGYLQNLSDIRGGGEVKISEPEKKKTPQERLQELYRDDYFINASPVLKAKKLARVIKEIHDDIPVGQRLLAKGEQYHKLATEGQSGLERYLTEAIIMAGEMAPGLLATGLSGGAAAPGLITMGAQAAGQTMGSLESQGVNPVEAFERGALSGFIEAGTELIPLKHLLKMGKGEGKSFAKELITQLIEEVGTEEASEILGFAVDEYYEKPDLTAETLWKDIQNSLLPSMKDTAAITALTTLGMGTGAGTIGSMRKRVDAQDLTTPTVEDLAKQREALEAEKAQWEMVNARLLDRLQNNTDDPRVHKFFLQELQEHEAKKKELEAKEAGLTMQEMARNEIEAQKQELEQAEQGQTESKPEAIEEPKQELPATQDQAQHVQQEPQPQQQTGSNPLLDAIGKRFGAEEQQAQTQQQEQPQTNPAEALRQSAQPQTQEQERTQTGKYKPGLDWNDEHVKSFSAKVAHELDTVAKMLGVHIRFDNLNENVDRNDPEAVYDEGYIEDGVITLSRDIERPVEYVLGHEITHRMQELAPEEYGVLKDYVKGLGKYQDMVDAKIDEYRRGGETLDEEEAWDEITADFAGDIIGSEELMSDFIRGVSHEPTLLQKIKEFFQDLAAKLTGNRKVQVQKAIRMIDNALGKSAEVIENGEDFEQNTNRRDMYAGRKAKNADPFRFTLAEQMEQAGDNAETIRTKSDMFRGDDSKWRWEFSDKDAQFDSKGNAEAHAERDPSLENNYTKKELYEPHPIYEFLIHKELFDNYPELQDIDFRIEDMDDSTTRGYFEPSKNEIVLNSDYFFNGKESDILNTIIHEMQHAVQRTEGFASGSSPEYWKRRMDRGDRILSKGEEELQRKNNDRIIEAHVDTPELYNDVSDLVNMEPNFADSFERDPETGDLKQTPKQLAFEARMKELNDKYGEEVVSDLYYAMVENKDFRDPETNPPPDYAYRLTAGENEARDTASRRNLTDEARRLIPPNLSEGNAYFTEGNAYFASYEIRRDENNTPFVVVERNILDGVPREDWVKVTKDNLRDRFPNGVKLGGDIIKINRQTRNELTYSDYSQKLKSENKKLYRDKLKATDAADELIQAAQGYVTEPLYKERDDGLHDFTKGDILFRIGNKDYQAKVVIATQKGGGKILYDITRITRTTIKERAARAVTPKSKSAIESTNDSNGIVAQDEQDINRQTAEKVGVEIYEENSSASRRMYSKRTYEQSDYVQDREKAAKVLAKNLKVSVKKAKKYIDDINTIAAKIGEDRLRLDYEPNPYLGKPGKKGFDSSLVSNTEYGGSIDFSTICKKRRLYTGTIEAIQKAFPNKALTADEMLTIRNMMKERGYEVACGMCYVEGSRAKFGEYAQQFIDELKKEDASRIPNIAEINTIDGLKKIRAEEPELYKKYTDFINSLSQRKPKLFMSDTEYNGEILAFEGKKDKKTGESMIQKYNDNGGFRLQSFSDFEIIHLIDAMQVIMDMSRVGLKGQAYTKVADFAKALGNTGLKINLSMVAKGLDENGRLVFDEVEGMKESEALELRDKHPDNVGTVVVCFTADQIRAALMDDRIDFVLPFHHSQWSAEQFEAMGLPDGTRSFQSFQNDYPKEGKKENLKPLTFWNFNKDGRWNAERYLKICHKEGITPKFAKFHGNDYLLVKNDDGSYSLPDGPIGDNYWKLLIDVKMYNHLTGKGAKPKVVSPEFDMEEANRMLEDYTGGHETLPVAQDIVDEFTEMENTKAHLRNGGQLQAGGKVPSKPRFSKRMRQDYSDAAKAKDTQTASKIVREAAAQAGYTVPVYHGTQQFGFTVPEGSKGDDGISFFVTGDIDTARTYSDSEGVRQISDKRSSPESRRQLANDARFEAADGIVKLSRKLDEMSKDLFNPTTMLIMMSEDIENASDRDEAEGVVEDYFDSLLEHLYNRLEGNEDNAPDDLEFDWLLDEGNEITNQFRKEFEDARQLFYSLAQTTWSGEDYGNYNLFLDPTGLLEVNGGGKQWWGIPFEPVGIASTREIAKWAKDHDYTGVHFKDIVDDGGKGIERSGPADVYAIFSPEYQTKSADPFTYDDKGNLIPLEERFDPNNPDWRWSKRKLGDNSMHESIYGKKKLPRRKRKRPERTESDRQGPYSVGAAPSGFNRFSEWQNQSNDFHPVNPRAEIAEADNWNRAPVEIPTKDLYGKLTSKTASTFANAGMTPNQVSDELANMATDGRLSRIPFKDKTAVAHAEKVIQDKGYQRAKELWQRDMDHGNMGKNVTVMGITLYNAAANSGHITEAIDIATDMIGYAKTVAQSLQAVNIINKLGPTGKLYSLTRSIEKLEEQIRRKKKLDPEHWSGITIPEDLAKAYMDAKTLEEQREIEVEIKKAIAKQIPNTLKDKFDAWRYTAMLGNPRTQVRNILGNMGFQPLRITKNAIGAGLERMAGIDQSRRTKAVQFKAFSKDDKARYQAGLDEYEDVQDIIMGNGKFNDDFSDIDQYRTIFKFKPFEKWRELTNWGLEKGDIFFAKRTYADSLAGVLKARGITAEQYQSSGFDQHEKEAIQAIAIDEAQKATYRDLNQFSKYVAGLGKKQDTAAEKVAHYLTEGLLPFKKTPANILVRGLEYSPLGLIKGVVDMGTKVKNGEITAAQGIDEIASGLTGTGMLALGIALGLSGIVSPGDDEDDKQNKFNELIGKQSYALNLPGGYSFTLDWLAPESIPFFVGVELQNAAREVEEGSAGSDLAWNALRRMADPVLEQSMLQGVTDMLENVSYADNKAASILTTLATGYLSQFVPTIGGQLERTLEDRRYSTWIDRNSKIPSEIQYLLAKNLNKIPIPGVEYNQRERLNAWGEPEMSGNLAVRALTNFLSPGYIKKETSGEVEAELQRLYDLGFDNVFPTIEKTTSKINGEPVSMEQFQLLQASKGQLAKELYSDAIGSAEYEALSDADKADYLSNLQKYAKTMGRQAAGEDPSKVPQWMQRLNQAAEDHDVGVSALLRASMTIDSKYDADGNGSVKTEEAFAGVQDMAKNGLPENEQRAIFDMYNGTKKTYDEYKAEADKKAEVQANIDKYISTLPQDMQTSLMESCGGNLNTLSQAEAYSAILDMGGTYEQQKAAYEGIQAARGDSFWKEKGKPRSFDSFMKKQGKEETKQKETSAVWGGAPQEDVDAFHEAAVANDGYVSYHGFFDSCEASGIPRSEWPSAYADANGKRSKNSKWKKSYEQAYYHVFGQKWAG